MVDQKDSQDQGRNRIGRAFREYDAGVLEKRQQTVRQLAGLTPEALSLIKRGILIPLGEDGLEEFTSQGLPFLVRGHYRYYDTISFIQDESDFPILDTLDNSYLQRLRKTEAELEKNKQDRFGFTNGQLHSRPLLTALDEQALFRTRQRQVLILQDTKFIAQAGLNESDAEDYANYSRRATEAVVGANLLLVEKMARRYLGHNLDHDDMVSAGNIGLIRAIEKFQYWRGFKFSTYATWWVRQAITRDLADNSRQIRIPVHAVEAIGRLIKLQEEFNEDNGSEGSTVQLAKWAQDREGNNEWTVEKVREVTRYLNMQPSSANRLNDLNNENSGEVIDLVTANYYPDPQEAAEASDTRKGLELILSKFLTPREHAVLRARNGSNGADEGRTLSDIAEELGVSRERVRQIETEALRKLRDPSVRRKLEAIAP